MGKEKTGFFQRVYDVVAVIPKGKVMTYGQIAKRLGGFYSGRTVGFAMRAAPAERNLPCHRVVNRKGEMAPGFCFGGAERQRGMLKREGVKFLADGVIDLKKSLLSDAVEAEPEPAPKMPGRRRTRVATVVGRQRPQRR